MESHNSSGATADQTLSALEQMIFYLHFNNPYYVDIIIGPNVALVTQLYDGSNYHTWLRYMQQALSIQNKVRFTYGTLTEPKDPADP